MQAYSAVAQTAIAFVTLVVTAALTYLVYRGAKVIAAIEYGRSLRDAWMTFDAAALADDHVLEAADVLMGPGTQGDSMPTRRKRWLALMVMNILGSTFEGQREHFLKDEDAFAAFDMLLLPLVSDDEVFHLIETRGYGPSFRDHCRALRSKKPRAAAAAGAGVS
jgi:hypothetical protein